MFDDVLRRLGIEAVNDGLVGPRGRRAGGSSIESLNPSTGQPIARVSTVTRADYDAVVEQAEDVFRGWRRRPPPARGQFIRDVGEALRRHKDDLGLLVTLEAGKILSEGRGEVQEMIDMCEFATGLSRQLYGLTIASERPEHRLFEQWHPLGQVGVITAFNFPVAVWAWNAALAAVCGDVVIWKPSQLTPLTAIAVQHLVDQVAAQHEAAGVFNLCVSRGAEAGQWMSDDPRLPLISATGSCAMGRKVGPAVAARLGRSLLELGGNNAVIVSASANLDLALRAVLFAAVGTSGQRCTSLRRLFVHEDVAESFTRQLVAAYPRVRIGDPWEENILMGPLIRPEAIQQMQLALKNAEAQGGEILCGGKVLDRPGWFVQPTLVQARPDMPMVSEETFAPILYVMTYRDLDEVIEHHNAVPQGLSSALFSDRLQEAEKFLSPAGSDCGIANINIGTSGAEIGGAFGGEKETGGGREAGSDSWKVYMRRQTCTVNWGDQLPLAQGVEFEV